MRNLRLTGQSLRNNERPFAYLYPVYHPQYVIVITPTYALSQLQTQHGIHQTRSMESKSQPPRWGRLKNRNITCPEAGNACLQHASLVACGTYWGELAATLTTPPSIAGIWFDADAIIDRGSNPLYTAKVSFGRLNGNIPQKELDLFQLSSGSMAGM
jgi:hypothetical protein